jgi:uncharacterized membrane protein
MFKAMFNADDLKGFNEGLTAIFNSITGITKIMGGLPGILLTVGAMFSGKLIPMFRNGFNSVMQSISVFTGQAEARAAKLKA